MTSWPHTQVVDLLDRAVAKSGDSTRLTIENGTDSVNWSAAIESRS